MKSMSIFNVFLRESFFDVKNNFLLFLPNFFALLILSLSSVIPWGVMGVDDRSGWVISLAVLAGFLSLVVVTDVILTANARLLNEPKQRLLYNAPTYLVYMLYSTLAVLAGLVLFVIPGFVALIFLALAPLAALLSKDNETGYLKQSIHLVKRNFSLVSIYVIASLAIEVGSLLFDFIGQWQLRLSLGIIYSFFESFSVIVLTIVSVKIYYHLQAKKS